MPQLFHHCKLQLITLLTAILMCNFAVTLANVQPIWLEVNQTYFLNQTANISRISVGNPAVADVIVLGKTKVNIVAKAAGSTSLSIWTDDDMRQDFTISVSKQDTASGKNIQNAIDLPGGEVTLIGDRLMLKGNVENQLEMAHAVGIAQSFVGKDNIINLLQMRNPTLVNLAVMVVDISSTDATDFGLKYGNASQVSSNDTGTYGPGDITFGALGTFYGGMNYHSLSGHLMANVDAVLQALIVKNKAKVLSRPNITTLSGQEADILVGGEIPIPSSNSNGEISVTWREYGIKLHIKPVVDYKDKITTQVVAEVSNIDKANAVTTSSGTIPGLTSRKATTTINLPDGDTMAIGGLMNSQESKVVSKIPLLSSIPIIGEFFKSTSTSQDKRELMILVRPTIVTSSQPVKGSTIMGDTLESHKLEYANMEDLYPNDPPTTNPALNDKGSAENKTVSQAPTPGDNNKKTLH